jgi:hypothetical protein
MAATYHLLFDGRAADEALYDGLSSVEVEESLDLPAAIRLTLPVGRTPAGALTAVAEPRFAPYSNVVLVGDAGAGPVCLFDGYVLSHAVHLRSGVAGSTVRVWGQDASWLMNLEEKAREWAGVTDADAAATVFGEYGVTPHPENTRDESSGHPAAGHSLMQRATDIQFLRRLARRTGKVCRVFSEMPGARVGYFARPKLDAEPKAVVSLNHPVVPTVRSLDLTWDVARPTAVVAQALTFDDASGRPVRGDAPASDLTPLDERDLATFADVPMTAMLTAAVDTAGELALRAKGVLRESGWFVRCEGAAEIGRLGAVLRAGDIVLLDTITLHSGKYLVWSVKHTITRDLWQVGFLLVRNAVGPTPDGGPRLPGF